MKLQNGAHSPKKKGNFISNNFIISKNDTPQRKTGKIISIVALILIVAAIVIGGLIIFNYANAKNDKDNLLSMIPASETSSDGVSDPDVSGDDVVPIEEDEFNESGILKELEELYALNSDFIGHMYIPDTGLDVPVALTKTEPDNKKDSYYLNHTLEKESDPYGTPFLGWQSNIASGYQDKIITAYGHNSKAGDFFETVKLYRDIEFYKEHPILYFDTIYGKGQYKIIGRFTEYCKSGTYYFGFHEYTNVSEEGWNKYLTELDKRNFFNTGIDVDYEKDNLLALSTCNDEIEASATTPYRDVLVARKVRPGESLDIDMSKVTKNEDMIQPEGWVKKFGKANPYK